MQHISVLLNTSYIYILAFIRHFNKDIKKNKAFVGISEVIRESAFFTLITISSGQHTIFANDSLQFLIIFRFNIALQYFSTSSFIPNLFQNWYEKKKTIFVCYMKRYFSDIFVNSFISCKW